jgi:hypothetical protein
VIDRGGRIGRHCLLYESDREWRVGH